MPSIKVHSEGKWICCPGGTPDSHALPEARLWGSLEISTWAGFGEQDDSPWSWPQIDKTKPGTLPQLQFVWHSWKQRRGLPDGPGANSHLSCARQRSSWTTTWGPRMLSEVASGMLKSTCDSHCQSLLASSYLGLQATIFTRFLLGTFVKTKQTQKKTARLQLSSNTSWSRLLQAVGWKTGRRLFTR